MLSVCFLNFILLLCVPTSVGAVLVQDMGVFLSIIVYFVLYSLDQNVIRASVAFKGETFFLFERNHISNMLIYSCRWIRSWRGSRSTISV